MRIGLLRITIVLELGVGAAAAGCGSSEVEVRDAKTSGYQTDFAVVYSETLAAVRDLYPHLVEDARVGTIKTSWHPVHIAQGNDEDQVRSNAQQMSPTGSPSAFQATTSLRKNYFVRFDIHVVGGRPWRVRVHAQASSWKAGEIPTPLKGADVPAWLEPRKETLEVAIHRRLKKFAVRLRHERDSDRKARAARGRPTDLAKFGKLPPGAAQVVGQVEEAANTRDIGRLRPLMADEFTYSFGDSPSAETAIVMWQADPTILAEIGKALAAGCAQDPKDQQVVCPATFLTDENFTGYRAGFRNVGGSWKMVFFVAGD
jgi:hypothetical protein